MVMLMAKEQEMPLKGNQLGSWVDTTWYYSWTFACRIFHMLYAPITGYGREHVPAFGRVLIISNHQSLLDPFILAITSHRRLSYVGKREIFDIPVVGRAARSYGIFPVDREHADVSAAKTALRILNQEKALAILPEGTRSPSGRIESFQPGFVKVAIHAQAPVIPTAIVGAWEVWPRQHSFPRPGRIKVAYGEPIDLTGYRSGKVSYDLQDELSRQVRLRVVELAERLGGGSAGL